MMRTSSFVMTTMMAECAILLVGGVIFEHCRGVPAPTNVATPPPPKPVETKVEREVAAVIERVDSMPQPPARKEPTKTSEETAKQSSEPKVTDPTKSEPNTREHDDRATANQRVAPAKPSGSAAKTDTPKQTFEPPHRTQTPTANTSPSVVMTAEQQAVEGVPLMVFVPQDSARLAAHFNRSGGCLAVSELIDGGQYARVIAFYAVAGSKAVRSEACGGVPRILSPAMNQALGDPIGQVRSEGSGQGEIVLQGLFSPTLETSAHAAMAAHFVDGVPEREWGQLARSQSYTTQCRADENGIFCR